LKEIINLLMCDKHVTLLHRKTELYNKKQIRLAKRTRRVNQLSAVVTVELNGKSKGVVPC